MKKPKKSRKPKLAKAIKRPFKRAGDRLSASRQAASAEQKVADALQDVPRITNETVSEHREEVLSSARKHIYPLQHSKKSVVRISLGIFALVLAGFLLLCGLELYKFQSTGGFMYDVTRILPFPVAKTGNKWIRYEAYLFELRRNIHYYETQQGVDFSSDRYKPQLQRLKQQALAQVIQDSYIKQLAAQHGISASNQQVNDQLALVRNQNRLGNNDRVFREVLSEFWGWSEADFRRELRQQLLRQDVVARLDTQTQQKAEQTLQELHKKGADFGKIAAKVSDDVSTKASGGQYPAPISPSDRNLPPQVSAALFKLKPGQVSAIINTGYSFEIIKVTKVSGHRVTASHIQFNLQDISGFIEPLQKQQPVHKYVKV